METTQKIDQYEQQALDFCKKHNVQIHIVKSGTVQGFPNCKHDRHMTHIRNRVKITTALGSFGFYFYGSYADWQYGRKATPLPNPRRHSVLYLHPRQLQGFLRRVRLRR